MPKIHINCALLRRFTPKIACLFALGGLVGGCKTATEGDEHDFAAADQEPVLRCGDEGRLSTELYGAVEAAIDWDKTELECTGMPRPEGAGIRLRFAGVAEHDGQPVAFIIAIPDFARDAQVAEFSVNVTLIEEGSGRFFSTPDLNNCLVDIDAVEALDGSGDRYSVTGALFCVTPLPEVNGKTSVSIPELNFAGLLDWSAS